MSHVFTAVRRAYGLSTTSGVARMTPTQRSSANSTTLATSPTREAVGRLGPAALACLAERNRDSHMLKQLFLLLIAT